MLMGLRTLNLHSDYNNHTKKQRKNATRQNATELMPLEERHPNKCRGTKCQHRVRTWFLVLTLLNHISVCRKTANINVKLNSLKCF